MERSQCVEDEEAVEVWTRHEAIRKPFLGAGKDAAVLVVAWVGLKEGKFA